MGIETDFGVRMISLRNGGDGLTYLRVSNFVMPCHVQHLFSAQSTGDRRGKASRRRHRRRHIKVRNLRNNYLQDREEQKSETFRGPLADSSTEHLGAGDITVIAVRKFMLQAVRALDRGKEPPHIIRTPEQNDMSLSPAW